MSHARIADKISSLGGDPIAEEIVAVADAEFKHIATHRRELGCALIQHESGFKNVYGHDGVKNPIKSPPHGLLRVTAQNYPVYLEHRNRGEGMQGVGYGQLTYYTYQDRADRLGGCWKTVPNLTVAFSDLDAMVRAYGLRDGLAAYNAGPGGRHGATGQHYATAVLALEAEWRKITRR